MHDLGDTKVTQLYLSVCVDEYVGRLNVSVYHVISIQSFHSSQYPMDNRT
eukprot:m.1269576 g.1269576  ORF g.1269576 m.1269576 type:complete len:50 (+) comp24747_c0_seq5:4277-4426(+)